MSESKSRPDRVAQTRARRRAAGLLSIEAVFHRDDIAALDRLKERLGVASRSEVLRIVLAKIDQDTLTPADTALLQQSAA